MRRHSCVLFLLLSILGLTTSASAQAVGSDGKQDSGFILEQNYPNPFNPETKIPFVLFEDLFVDGKPVVVSVRIFNVLQQFITAPTALNHPNGEGVRVLNLEYPFPGKFEAYWDGRDERGRQVASGVYFVQLTVNGKTQFQRMYVTK
ncbi:MAG: hypothetical protein HKO65_09130 [Gemmatimonadetes bacterium]|nr:hypothetical protein [Gemmatimonadota bacterium]